MSEHLLTSLLRKLAEESGGQAKAAQKCGTTQQTYSAWLLRSRRPQSKFHYGIGLALGLSEKEVRRLAKLIPSQEKDRK